MRNKQQIMKIIRIPLECRENYENHRIPCARIMKIFKSIRITYANHENHKNHKMIFGNYENH